MMLSRLFLCALALIGGALAAMPASAQDSIAARTLWIILPSEQQSGSVRVRGGDSILNARIVPASLTALDAPAMAPDRADSLLDEGAQLFRLSIRSAATVICSTEKAPINLGDVLLIRTNRKFVCLIDSDSDGVAESFYHMRTDSTPGVPIFTRAKLTGTALASPVAYHRVDPREFAQDYQVSIVYEGKPLFGRRPHIRVDVGTRGHMIPLQGGQSIDLRSDERSVALMRAQLELMSESDGVAEITITRGIPAQPFILVIPPPRIVFY